MSTCKTSRPVAFLEKIEEYFVAEQIRKQKMKEKRSESNEGEDYKIDEIIKLLSSTCRSVVKNETSKTASK